MILCLDVGNSQIYGGAFVDGQMRLSFRRSSRTGASSDEMGLFLRQVLRENGLDPSTVKQVAVCTVVPDVLHSLRNSCIKYFNCQPFVLQTGVRTGLKIKYRNPAEVGADRIANVIAAVDHFPERHLVIVDFGTATTFCAVHRDREYLGGVIIAGLRISMSSLESHTAKLPSVEIVTQDHCLGKSTVESIQSGLFFGHLGAVKEITRRLREEVFHGEVPLVIGTGGFAGLFSDTGAYDVEIPDLVLQGLHRALIMNANA